MSTQNLSDQLFATRDQAGHILGSVEKQLLSLPRGTAQLVITKHLAQYQARHQRMLDDLVTDVSNTVTIKVEVKRGRTGCQVFRDTGRMQYVIDSAAADAPLIAGEGYEKVEFTFFKVGSVISDAQVEKEREKRGLIRDLEAQAQANADCPEFADEHPNGDSWQDKDGTWCFAYFSRGLGDERSVDVNQSDDGWNPGTWIGGVACKLPLAT